MKAPVGRISILRFARGAHAKFSHGGGRAVVGNVGDDGVAGAAIGAIRKRIAVPPIFGLREIAQAVVTGRYVRGHQRKIAHPRPALPDLKTAEITAFQIRNVHFRNARQCRRPAAQLRHEAVYRRAFRLDLHPGFGIAHEAADSKPLSQIRHERPEAHPLHRAANPNLFARRRRSSVSCFGPRNATTSLIMCLAVPGKILETTDLGLSRVAKVEFGGVTRQVYLDFVPEAQPGDYVLVHVGFAISRLVARGSRAHLRPPPPVGGSTARRRRRRSCRR